MKTKDSIEPIESVEHLDPTGHYSDCCGVLTFMWEYGICPFCKEHCCFEDQNGKPFEHNAVNAITD